MYIMSMVYETDRQRVREKERGVWTVENFFNKKRKPFYQIKTEVKGN